jgi:hypothetical protein
MTWTSPGEGVGLGPFAPCVHPHHTPLGPLQETELRCAVDAELVARLKRHWETTRVRRVTLGDPL